MAKSNTLPADTHYMKPNKLQCTAHIHRGPDVEYENTMFKVNESVNEKCMLKGLFWDDHRCAASVYLKPRMNTETPFNRNPWHPKPDFPFDVNNSAPHVSLAKGIRDQWRAIGPAACLEKRGWLPKERPVGKATHRH